MLKILHLSDLHFGSRVGSPHDGQKRSIKQSTHRFTQGLHPDPEALVEILKKDPACQEPPRIIVVSGDVGWSGKDKDYTFALKFFKKLGAQWKSTRLIVAPGNHDVDRAPPRDKGHQAAFIRMLQKLYSKRFQEIYPLFDPKADASKPSVRARLVAFDYDSENDVLVIAANSAAHLRGKSTPVFIDPGAIKDIESHIDKLKIPDKTLRVFVMHHHLFPFAEPVWSPVIDRNRPSDRPDSTLVANSAKLQAWLADRSFQLVLHGHKHLSHGRADKLWRREDPPEGRNLLVIGAGSAGVEQHHRAHEEPLSYNVLSINRLSRRRWSTRVCTQRIVENSVNPYASSFYEYTAESGPAPSGTPATFYAERMDDCHGAIVNATARKALIRGFISVVDQPEYFHPQTAQIKGRHATHEEVRKTFLSLHPEYETSDGWTRLDKLRQDFQKNSRFRFLHGPRLFGIPNRPHAWGFKVPEENMPIVHALDSLSAKNISRGYVGMFNAEVDIISENEPLPGLMSLQFIPDNGYLDLVATFRKIELSFWWVANMYEMIELLRWAATRKKFTPRRITFFAALAEWKQDPEVIFDAKLDKLNHEDRIGYVLGSMEGNKDSRHQLAELLREKSENTSDVHLEVSGLEALLDLMVGFSHVKTTGTQMPIAQIKAAVEELRRAIAQHESRQSLISAIRNHLISAAEYLQPTQHS